jgi:DNA topoisomerase-1
VEHLKLTDPATITLDFLGKDSMRYFNTVEVDKRVYKNLCEFMTKGKKPKKPENDLFDELTTSSLNKYLKDFMTHLSAKVFRTFNASLTLEKELAQMPKELLKATNEEKVLFYNRCNREVAILCNHQRTVSKTHGESMSKIDEKIAEYEHKQGQLKQQIAFLKGKGKKPVLTDSEDEEKAPKTDKSPKKPQASSNKNGTKKEKDEDDFETSNPKSKKRKAPEKGEEDDFQETPTKKKKRSLPESIDKCESAIARIEQIINKWNIKKTEKDDLKSVALTTSKINYIDPRITVAWAKKVNLPVEKLFTKSLREKFPWAMDVSEDWKF